MEGDSTSGHRLCPRGYYCPAGTGMDWKSCPEGTYSNELGLYMMTECQDCTSGECHWVQGLFSVSYAATGRMLPPHCKFNSN